MINYFKNLWQTYKDWKIEREFYCDKCQSCGEEGCCPIEQCLLNHGCKYGEYYAREVYYNKMVIDEFHKLLKELGYERDETGDVVIDPIGDVYDRAYKRVKEKYDKPIVITKIDLNACF